MADFDPTTPSIARVYDYLLNGKDNFAVDRAVADKLLAVAPISALVMRENRQFLARATSWAAEQGIGQFIDLGCGMPTTPNTHQSAQAVAAGAHVAYVDTDAVVLAHLRALAAQGNPGVTVVDGDVREVDVILDAISPGIDLSQPACLLMGALLHFFPPDAARDLVAGYAAALAPGSYVVLSVGRADGDAEATRVRHLLVGRRGAGVQPLGGRVHRLLRPADAGAAGRGRCPRMAPRTAASRRRCRPARARRWSASRA